MIGQEIPDDGVGRRDGKRACHLACDEFYMRRIRHGFLHVICPREKLPSCRGQVHAVRCALEKCRSNDLFEIADGGRDRRLRNGEVDCRLGHFAGFSRGDEVADLFQTK
jgi:hypothetical protein